DWAHIEKAALEISSHLGMLRPGGPPNKANKLRAEPLRTWVSCADRIQAIFFGQQAAQELTEGRLEIPTASLDMILSYKPDGVSMHLSPHDAGSALVYHASQMMTGGTVLQICEQCKSSFLSGGEARGGGKRRGDARFCSDRCRSQFHNEARRK